MDKPKFFLNPNAAPFIPKFKRASEVEFEEENMIATVMFHDSAMHEETEVHETFDPAGQFSTDIMENVLMSDEDPQGRHYQILEPEDHLPRYENMGTEKQDLEDSSQIASEYLSSLFPNFSLESVNEVYHSCRDVVQAKFMLEQLEGDDDKSHSHFSDPHSSGTASFDFHSDISSDSVSPPDSEAVQHKNSANTDSA